MKAQNEYGHITRESLEKIVTELFKSKPKKKEVFYINEGKGFIPFEKSELFNRLMKENINKSESDGVSEL